MLATLRYLTSTSKIGRKAASGGPPSLPTSDIGALRRLQNLKHLPVSERATLPSCECSYNPEVLKCRLRNEKLDGKAGSLPWLESIGEWHN
jgi:hypothetical protein